MKKSNYLAFGITAGLLTFGFSAALAANISPELPTNAAPERLSPDTPEILANVPESIEMNSDVLLNGGRILGLKKGLGQRGPSSLVFDRVDMTLLSGDLAEDTPGDNSFNSAVDESGDFVVFTSMAQNIVEGADTGGFPQIYLHQVSTGTTTLVSHSTTGALIGGNGGSGMDEFTSGITAGKVSRSWVNSISNDGTKVCFTSNATDLVAGDTNGNYDIFVWESTGGTITRVSTDGTNTELTGGQNMDGVISGDGLWVAFMSNATVSAITDNNVLDDAAARGGFDVFVKDLTGNGLTLVSHNNGNNTTTGDAGSPLTLSGDSLYPDISDDGSVVVYMSCSRTISAEAPTLPASDDFRPPYTTTAFRTWYSNVFAWDRTSNTNRLVSKKSDGSVAWAATGVATTDERKDCMRPTISGNGRWVTFASQKPLVAATIGLSRGYVVDLSLLDNDPTRYRIFTSDDTGTNKARGTAVTIPGRTTNDGLFTYFRAPFDGNGDTFLDIPDGTGYYTGVFRKNWTAITGSAGTTENVSRMDDGASGFFRDDRGPCSIVAPVDALGTNVNGGKSEIPAITNTGAFYTFSTASTYGDTFVTNGLTNVYRYETATDGVERCSVGDVDVASRIAFNDSSIWALQNAPVALSSSGRYVAMMTFANNFFDAPGVSALNDTGRRSVVRFDIESQTFAAVNVAPNGTTRLAPAGFFFSDFATTDVGQMWGRVGLQGTPLDYQGVTVSSNGRVAYNYWGNEYADAGDPTNTDAYAIVVPVSGLPFDITDFKSTVVGFGATAGTYFSAGPRISENGRYVAWGTPMTGISNNGDNPATNQYGAYLWDTAAATDTAVRLVSKTTLGGGANGAVLASSVNNGGTVVLANDDSTNMNGPGDVVGNIYVNLGSDGTVHPISTDASGNRDTDPTTAFSLTENIVNGAGSHVAFVATVDLTATGTRVNRVFYKDITGTNPATGALVLVTPGLVDDIDPAIATAANDGYISPDNASVGFTSDHPFVTPDNNAQQVDVFDYDIAGATTSIISQLSDGTQDEPGTPSLLALGVDSFNGRYWSFLADWSTAMIPGDCTAHADVYVVSLPGTPTGAVNDTTWNMYE